MEFGKGQLSPGVGCLQHIEITNGDNNLPVHDLLTPVIIILLSLKLNKILNIGTKFDTSRF